MDTWLAAYGVPLGAAVIAALGWAYGLFVSRSFRKKYPASDDAEASPASLRWHFPFTRHGPGAA